MIAQHSNQRREWQAIGADETPSQPTTQLLHDSLRFSIFSSHGSKRSRGFHPNSMDREVVFCSYGFPRSTLDFLYSHRAVTGQSSKLPSFRDIYSQCHHDHVHYMSCVRFW